MLGSVVGLSVIAGHMSAEITMTYGRLPGHPALSVAVIVKLKMPVAVGGPVIAPVAGLSDRPLGSVPRNGIRIRRGAAGRDEHLAVGGPDGARSEARSG